MAPRRAATQALTQGLESEDRSTHSGNDVGQRAIRRQDGASHGTGTRYLTSLGSNGNVTPLWQFLVTAAITLVLQTVFSALVDQSRGKELGNVSRHINSVWSVLGLTTWKVLELGVGWYAGYGNVAIAPFIALLHLPHIYLLNAFYQVPFPSLLAELISNFSSASLAFSVFRRPDVYKKSSGTPVVDESLRNSFVVPISSAAFSTGLYAVLVLTSLSTWLPSHLAVHWDGLRTLESAYDVSLFRLFRHLIGMGWCTTFLLLGYTSSIFDDDKDNSNHNAEKRNDTNTFDPATASLEEHLSHNFDALLFWRHAKPAGRSLLKHTIFLAVCLSIDAAFQSCATIEGCGTAGQEWLLGPLPWGCLWGAGMLTSGLGLGWMAGVWL